jgi:hypothetical protein
LTSSEALIVFLFRFVIGATFFWRQERPGLRRYESLGQFVEAHAKRSGREYKVHLVLNVEAESFLVSSTRDWMAMSSCCVVVDYRVGSKVKVKL